MNRPAFVRSRPSAVAPMAGWDFGFPILAAHQNLFKEFTRAIWPASHDGNAEPRVRSQQSNLSLSHPASPLCPLPGSHAAGRVPPAGRTFIRHSRSRSPSQETTTNGTAVGLGSPYGVPGIRYVGSPLHKLRGRGTRKTVIGLCRAGGMAAPLTSNGDSK